MAAINIATLNVDGARSERKRACLYELIRLKRINVMFIQEMHSDVVNEIEWKKEWEGEIILSHLSRCSGGIAILFSKDFIPQSYTVYEKIDGRLLVVKAIYEHFTLVFVNVYAPNTGAARLGFLAAVNETLTDCGQEDFLFLGGDFNCTDNDVLDRNHVEPHVASKNAMRHIVETHGLADVWRMLNPGKKTIYLDT